MTTETQTTDRAMTAEREAFLAELRLLTTTELISARQQALRECLTEKSPFMRTVMHGIADTIGDEMVARLSRLDRYDTAHLNGAAR
jgi:hypothetical protein